MNARLELTRHPCFNEDAKHHFGRLHLPVAPKCNIKCNYCDRKYDCVNESRLAPAVPCSTWSGAALAESVTVSHVISVVGIAGPSLANPWNAGTLRLTEGIPRMLLCLATTVWPCPAPDDLWKSEHRTTVTVNATTRKSAAASTLSGTAR
jgi:nitrogen fixation protein NifB